MTRFFVACVVLVAFVGPATAGSPVPKPALISFADARHGVASFGSAAGWTADGGRSWHHSRSGHLLTLDAIAGTRDVWAVVGATSCGRIPVACDARLVHSMDGGRRWSPTGAPLLGAAFANRVDGWAFRPKNGIEYGRLVATRDGGRSWHAAQDPCPRAQGKIAALASARHGWVLCLAEPGTGQQGKALFETTDSARHWRVVNRTGSTPAGLPGSGYAEGMALTARGFGLLWEARGDTYRTTDGGRTWRRLSLTSPELKEVVSASVVRRRLAFVLLRNGQTRRLELRRSDYGLRHWGIVRTWPLA